jgi:hypothetical protein
VESDSDAHGAFPSKVERVRLPGGPPPIEAEYARTACLNFPTLPTDKSLPGVRLIAAGTPAQLTFAETRRHLPLGA